MAPVGPRGKADRKAEFLRKHIFVPQGLTNYNVMMTPRSHCYYSRGVYMCLIFEMSIWEFITNLNKNPFRNKLGVFFFKFELDFYCLCSLQKSISKSNWFFNFLNLIFRNWKKFKWHLIFQKSSGDRQEVSLSTELWIIFLWLAFFSRLSQ